MLFYLLETNEFVNDCNFEIKDHVYQGKSTEELAALYLGKWMYPYTTLKYVSVTHPINFHYCFLC